VDGSTKVAESTVTCVEDAVYRNWAKAPVIAVGLGVGTEVGAAVGATVGARGVQGSPWNQRDPVR